MCPKSRASVYLSPPCKMFLSCQIHKVVGIHFIYLITLYKGIDFHVRAFCCIRYRFFLSCIVLIILPRRLSLAFVQMLLFRR